MWIFLKNAFLTVVENQKDDSRQTVIVRARVKADMERFKKDYVPESAKDAPITFHKDYDYPFRMIISKVDYGQALMNASLDIDYRKYKDAAGEVCGPARKGFYTQLWSKLIGLEEDPRRIDNYFHRGMTPREAPRTRTDDSREAQQPHQRKTRDMLSRRERENNKRNNRRDEGPGFYDPHRG